MKIKKMSDIGKRRLKLIHTSRDIIISNGWNKNLFEKISNEKNIHLSELYVLFPNGYKDMLILSLHNLNSEFEQKFNRSKIRKFPLHKRIKIIVMAKIALIGLEKKFYKKIFYYLLFLFSIFI